ncbi:hypothetical protein ACLOJK_017154 [Asimina triloba]
MDLRSKARVSSASVAGGVVRLRICAVLITLMGPEKDPHKLPKWNYDGSSTGQAPGDDSEVMCDAYTPAGEPIPTNKRFNAENIFRNPAVVAEEPW